MIREKAKSMVMLLLSLTMVFLVIQTWEIELVSANLGAKNTDIIVSSEDVYNLCAPFKVQVSFGGGQRTSFFYDKNGVFAKNREHILKALTGTNIVSKIEKNQYLEATDNKSIEFYMLEPLGIQYFASMLQGENSNINSEITKVKSILLVAKEPKNIYIFDGENYFLIKTDFANQEFVSMIDGLKSDDIVYYQSIANRFATKSDVSSANYVYVPRTRIKPLPILELESALSGKIDDLSIFSNSYVHDIASKVFGSGLNFVREAVDTDDSLVLMYGYGSKILRFKGNMIQYSENIKNSQKVSSNIVDDLKIAISWLKKAGNEMENLSILSIYPIDDNQNKGHEINFYYRAKTYPVLDANLNGYISARIINSKIANIQYIPYSQGTQVPQFGDLPEFNKDREQIYEILNDKVNFQRFYDDYMQKHANDISQSPEVEQIPKDQLILRAISDFNIIYMERNKRLIPCFVLQIEDRNYIIDFYNYSILN